VGDIVGVEVGAAVLTVGAGVNTTVGAPVVSVGDIVGTGLKTGADETASLRLKTTTTMMNTCHPSMLRRGKPFKLDAVPALSVKLGIDEIRRRTHSSIL
jgi:hypothetical protein